MKKKLLCIIAALFLCLLSACGSNQETEEEAFSTLYIEKDGQVIGQIVEDFDEDYYYEDELKDMIQETVDTYNKSAGGERVIFKSCEKIDNAVSVKLSYQSAEDYTAFNGETLFLGTVQEAYNAGFDLDVVMTDSVLNSAIGKDDILSMGDKNIIISNENVRVSAYANVAYVSDGVSMLGEREVFLPNTDTYSILILK